ncbi:MAG: DUF4846 domain-containing protein [Chitinophagaceae bacterium]
MPLLYLLFMIAFTSCNNYKKLPAPAVDNNVPGNINPYATIADIPLPPGFKRPHTDAGSFAAWLLRLPLKKNKTVYTYNGLPKRNQSAQFAVIDISVGDKDLQQCADAVMRLRAEYLYSQKKNNCIDFSDNNHTHYRLANGADRNVFNQYLEKVFSYCGTASLDKQLLTVNDFRQIAAGDVLIKGGSPGHAMQVMDIAVNKEGKKIYLLAQSYMPAQDMHVVINPVNSQLSPWYEVNEQAAIETPEWVFKKNACKKWPSY